MADAFKAILHRVHLQPPTNLPRAAHAFQVLVSSQVQLRENTRSVLLEQASKIRRRKKTDNHYHR